MDPNHLLVVQEDPNTKRKQEVRSTEFWGVNYEVRSPEPEFNYYSIRQLVVLNKRKAGKNVN